MTEEHHNPQPRPPWLDELASRLGPDPSIVDIATRLAAHAMPVVKTVTGVEVLSQVSVDLAAAILREVKSAVIVDEEGRVLADLQVSNDGLYWATIREEVGLPTTLMQHTRPEIEASVRAHVAKAAAAARAPDAGPKMPGVIRGGGA